MTIPKNFDAYPKARELAYVAAAWLLFNVVAAFAYAAVLPKGWMSLEAALVFALISSFGWIGLMRLYRRHLQPRMRT